MVKTKEKATFAAGCFWGIEEAFRKVDGVISIAVGYTGGSFNNPTYKDVCTDTTGHAEAVEIIFDPNKVSYKELLKVFWKLHDPSQLNRQGPDIGTQYRSAIFYHNEEQKNQAEESLKEYQKSFDKKIVTEIIKVSSFFKAEEYHQQYLAKKGLSTC